MKMQDFWDITLEMLNSYDWLGSELFAFGIMHVLLSLRKMKEQQFFETSETVYQYTLRNIP
jgi:hypothetical protein